MTLPRRRVLQISLLAQRCGCQRPEAVEEQRNPKALCESQHFAEAAELFRHLLSHFSIGSVHSNMSIYRHVGTWTYIDKLDKRCMLKRMLFQTDAVNGIQQQTTTKIFPSHPQNENQPSNIAYQNHASCFLYFLHINRPSQVNQVQICYYSGNKITYLPHKAVAEVSKDKEPIGRECAEFNWFESQLMSDSNELRVK